jgi:hypothetical protein
MPKSSSTKGNTGDNHQDGLSVKLGNNGKSAVYAIPAGNDNTGGSKMSLKYHSERIKFEFKSKQLHVKMDLGRSEECEPIGFFKFGTDAKGKLLYPFRHPRDSGVDQLSEAERLVVESILRGKQLECPDDDSTAKLLGWYQGDGVYAEEYGKPGWGSIAMSWTEDSSTTTVVVSGGPAPGRREYRFSPNSNAWVANGSGGVSYVSTDSQGRVTVPFRFPPQGRGRKGAAPGGWRRPSSEPPASETRASQSQSHEPTPSKEDPNPYDSLFESLGARTTQKSPEAE